MLIRFISIKLNLDSMLHFILTHASLLKKLDFLELNIFEYWTPLFLCNVVLAKTEMTVQSPLMYGFLSTSAVINYYE